MHAPPVATSRPSAGVCGFISKITRFSGELFALFIGIVFMQEAVRGTIAEFRYRRCSGRDPPGGADCVEFSDTERLANGLWALLLALCTLASSELLKTARSWPFFKVRRRGVVADARIAAWQRAQSHAEGANALAAQPRSSAVRSAFASGR